MYQHQTSGNANASQCSIFGCSNPVNGRRHCEKHTAKRSHKRFLVRSRVAPSTTEEYNISEVRHSPAQPAPRDDNPEVNHVLGLPTNGSDGAAALRQLAPSADQTKLPSCLEPSRDDSGSSSSDEARRPAITENGYGGDRTHMGEKSDIRDDIATTNINAQHENGPTVPRRYDHEQVLLQNIHGPTKATNETTTQNENSKAMALYDSFSDEEITGIDKQTAICISSDSEAEPANYTYANDKERKRRLIVDLIDEAEEELGDELEDELEDELQVELESANSLGARRAEDDEDCLWMFVPTTARSDSTTEKPTEAAKRKLPFPPPSLSSLKQIQKLPRKRTFDSDAFDKTVYQQVQPRKRPSAGASAAPSADEGSSRLYLPVNPAIHRPHNRPQGWYDEKMQETKKRGNRKTWFGKATARMAVLYDKEQQEQLQRRRKASQADRNAPLRRQDPQPRTSSRVMDFGDVSEDVLPEEVRSNPAWLKAAAWHRMMRQGEQEQSMSHKHRLTWRQYTNLEQETAKKPQKGN